MNRPAPDEGRASEECRLQSAATLRRAAPWLVPLLVLLASFAIFTKGRALLPAAAVPYAFASCVVLVLVGGIFLGFALCRAFEHRRARMTVVGCAGPETVPLHRECSCLRTRNCGEVVRTDAPRRVRAGGPPPLRPSYDGRTQHREH